MGAKFTAILADVLALLLAGLPLQVVLWILAIARPNELLYAWLGSAAIATLGVGLGVLAGVWCSRQDHALVLTIAFGLLLTGALGQEWAIKKMLPLWRMAVYPWETLWTPLPIALGFGVAAALSLRIAWRRTQPRETFATPAKTSTPTRRRPVCDRPLLWREFYCGYSPTDKKLGLFLVVLLLVGLMAVTVVTVTATGKPGVATVTKLFAVIVFVAVTAGVSAGGGVLAVEQRCQTLEALKTTRLTQAELVQAKLALLGLATVPASLCLVMTGVKLWHLGAIDGVSAGLLILHAVVAVAFSAVFGIAVALAGQTALVASAWASALLFAAWTGPVLALPMLAPGLGRTVVLMASPPIHAAILVHGSQWPDWLDGAAPIIGAGWTLVLCLALFVSWKVAHRPTILARSD